MQRTQIGVTSIPVSRLKTIPILFGESDIIKALTTTPGVSTGNEGTSGLLVRGGTPDQNLILLDDAIVYNTAHLFGLVSIFNTDAIKNVDLYKSGFPARFGGRLSSVLDISMKEGNNQRKRKELTVGLISSKLLLEGPLSDKLWGKASYMISARTSYLTPFLLPQIIQFKRGNAAQMFNYWLYDVNAKINYKVNAKTQIFASFYHGNDFWVAQDGLVNDRGKFSLNWGNLIGSLRMNYIIHLKLFLKTIASTSNYRYQVGNTSYEAKNNDWRVSNYLINTSSIRDINAKVSFEWFPLSFQQVRFGFDATNHQYSPTQINTNFTISQDSLFNINKKIIANEYSAFIENEMDIARNFKVNLGLRRVFFNTDDKRFDAIEPRVTANVLLPRSFAFKLGYSQMNQFIHLLSSNNVGLPNDIWVPATRNINPSFSEQLSFGMTKFFSKQHLELTLEVYQKSFKNLIDYSDGKNFFSSFNTSWENLVEKNGIGRIKGLEIFLNKPEGVFTGWISYTLSKNERRFENINKGDWFAANFDRRHSLSITTNYSPKNSKRSFAASWIYQSGQPITVPTAVYEQFNEGQTTVTGYTIPIYESRNNYRMPTYHRLDFSYNVKKTTKKHRDAMLSLGIYNVYNRVNPYYLDLRWQPNPRPRSGEKFKGVENKLYKVGIIPVLPFFSYSIKL
ncbi:MAG: TonB-dependent receptor plug domain-containing protein [Emticicia sp.]|nr:TonB-dependent receptor plug domain-containing protein [Emticicia sp.]